MHNTGLRMNLNRNLKYRAVAGYSGRVKPQASDGFMNVPKRSPCRLLV